MGKSVFNEKRGTIFLFDPDDLVISDDKDHGLYDQRTSAVVDEGLVLNIMFKNQGVLEPILVYKDGGQAVVIDGRQRVKAAREANRRLREQGKEPLRVPCFNKRGKTNDLLGMMISTNEHRLEDDVIVKAEKLNRYLNGGGTEEEAAVVFGVSRSTISNWLKMLDLDDGVRNFVKEGELSASAAAELSSMPRSEQGKKAKELVAGGVKSASGVRRAVISGRTNPTKRTRGRLEIEEFIRKNSEEEIPKLHSQFIAGLKWVLREEDDVK